jgi:hypothetical protein
LIFGISNCFLETGAGALFAFTLETSNQGHALKGAMFWTWLFLLLGVVLGAAQSEKVSASSSRHHVRDENQDPTIQQALRKKEKNLHKDLCIRSANGSACGEATAWAEDEHFIRESGVPKRKKHFFFLYRR